MPTTIKRADLVGTWAVATPSYYNYPGVDTVMLKADSTWKGTGSVLRPEVSDKNPKRWDLLPGDRLQVGDVYSRKIAFQGPQQFFAFEDDWEQCFREGGDHLIFKRITP